MLIKLSRQWINTQYIESMCVTGNKECFAIDVFMVNSEGPYKYSIYDTYEEAINAMDALAERINKEKE